VVVYLLEMYSKCGSMRDAKQLFDSMSPKPLSAWNALIVGFAIQGETMLVFSFLENMMESGIRPDAETFCSVLVVCAHACMLVESLISFDMMLTKFNIIPNIKHHTCLVDLLGRAGHLQDAILVLEEMPFQPDLVLLRAMLGACRRRGNLELGEEMFEFAMGLDEKHSGSYVLMSNIYVDHYSF
jgi:pentatricopeptide repeat protein